MSKYTTQLRYIVENYSDPTSRTSERINQSLPFIFDFDYPIWSEDYRKILERKIIMHYFNKEIGLETVGLWKLYLEERLNLIMPYYNEIYQTVSKKYEWLEDVNYTEKYEGDKNNISNVKDNGKTNTINMGTDTTISSINETNETTNNKNYTGLTSDTPQANFNGEDYASELKEDKQSETNNNTHNGTSNSVTDKSDNITTTMDNKTDIVGSTKDLYTRTMKGLNGSKSLTTLNIEYRNSLINIDKMIIEELYDLFMLIY